MDLIVPLPLPRGVTLEVAGPSVRLDTDRWLRRALRRRSRSLALRRSWERATVSGWPMRLRLIGVGGEFVWLAAEYTFFDLRAAALTGPHREAWFEASGDEVVAALASAHPDWQDAELHIADLWADVVKQK